MEKMVFKNEILNIVFGSLLIIFAFVGYFTKIVEDYLPIIVAIVIILLSAKRFIYTFKKIVSKNATLILVIEFILDLVFAGLLIYLGKHVELFLGLVVYTRGVSYLIINYVATRKVNLTQYIVNILYVTFGSFLIFTSYNSVEFISILISVVMLVVGAVFLQFGIKVVTAKEKKEELEEKKEKEKKKVEKEIEKSRVTKLQEKVKEVEAEHKKVESENKELEKKVKEVEKTQKKEVVQEIKKVEKVKEVEKIDYNIKTLIELKEIAKKRNLTGVSQLNKAELIAKLKE